MCLANFDVTDEEEITLKGFLTLHEMAAEDKEGGEEELWHVARGLGYDTRLQLNQVLYVHELVASSVWAL